MKNCPQEKKPKKKKDDESEQAHWSMGMLCSAPVAAGIWPCLQVCAARLPSRSPIGWTLFVHPLPSVSVSGLPPQWTEADASRTDGDGSPLIVVTLPLRVPGAMAWPWFSLRSEDVYFPGRSGNSFQEICVRLRANIIAMTIAFVWLSKRCLKRSSRWQAPGKRSKSVAGKWLRRPAAALFKRRLKVFLIVESLEESWFRIINERRGEEAARTRS